MMIPDPWIAVIAETDDFVEMTILDAGSPSALESHQRLHDMGLRPVSIRFIPPVAGWFKILSPGKWWFICEKLENLK